MSIIVSLVTRPVIPTKPVSGSCPTRTNDEQIHFRPSLHVFITIKVIGLPGKLEKGVATLVASLSEHKSMTDNQRFSFVPFTLRV